MTPPAIQTEAQVVATEAQVVATYREHASAVYGLACRMCGPALAAEVTHEVFVGLWRHPERFDPTRGPSTANALYREAALVLGVPEGTVKSRIRAALVKLQRALGDLSRVAGDQAA